MKSKYLDDMGTPIPWRLSNGKLNPAYTAAYNRARGINPRKQSGQNKYGIPSHLPNGKQNPKYSEARKRANGIQARKPVGQNKYGVPYRLPDGNLNPEYSRRASESRRRAKGIKPKGKYGIPTHLKDGRYNPAYSEAQRRAQGIKPKVFKYLDIEGNPIPSKLPNGKQNPDWGIAFNRSRGMKPRPPNWGNTYGTPYKLPDGSINKEYWIAADRAKGIFSHKPKYKIVRLLPNGKINPVYSNAVNKRYRNSLKGKTAINKHRQLPPLEEILGKHFEGAHLHHMTKLVGVWIPEELHRSVYHNIWTGKNMDKINTLAMEFYEREGQR